MFALGWGWDGDKNLLRKLRSQMKVFKTCNASLFHNIELLRKLPDEELFRLHLPRPGR